MRRLALTLGWVTYAVSFALPSWHDCCTTYFGIQAFLWALAGAAFLAWLANPLLWIAGILHWRNGRATEAVVVLACAAIPLAVFGTLWFRGDRPWEEPMIGVYLWITAQALIAAGVIAGFIVEYRQRPRFQRSPRWSLGSGGDGGDEGAGSGKSPRAAP